MPIDESKNNNYNYLVEKFRSVTQGYQGHMIFGLIIISLIIILLVTWIYKTLGLKEESCKKLEIIYQNNSFQTKSFIMNNNISARKDNNSSNYFDIQYECLLKNYYVKTAYNCCCADGYKNNFVSECALIKCINLGARCLDFEIYSYNGEPIVAASTANNNSIKETFNYLKLSHVFDILNSQSFSDVHTSCFNDPMFLHFRIMSENKTIYDKMGTYIKDNLDKDNRYLLDENKYNYLHIQSDKLLTTHITSYDLKKKFIIMVNTKNNNLMDNSKLKKYVNLRSGSKNMKLLRYENVVAMGNNNPILIDDSKTSLIMVLPNLNNSLENYDPVLPQVNGCQFIGMKFQNLDNNLYAYLKQFKDYGSFSFILKPSVLRLDENQPIQGSQPSNLNNQTTDRTV